MQQSTPRTIAIAQRQAKAVRLRLEGHSYQAIADMVPYADRSAARRAVETARQHIIEEPARELQAQELERLDDLLIRCRQVLVDGGDPELVLKAVDRLVKISETRRKLLGLDAPAKSDVTSGGEATQVVFHTALNPDTA